MAAWGFQTDSKPATTEQPTATSWGSAAPAAPSQPAQPTQNGTNGSISGWGAATNGDSNHAAGPSSWGGAAPSAPANGASASTGGWGNGESAAPAAQPSNGWPAQAEGTGSWGAPDANGVPNGSEAPPAEPEDDKDRQQRVDDLLKDLENEIQVKLSDKQADPNSPLYSVKTFEELSLSDELKKGIYAMGYEKPSKIQERALPLLLANPPKNMIAQSQSGTGKTAAFVLAMLSRLDQNDPSLQAICLSPARELADQSLDVLNKMGKFINVKTFFAGKGSARGLRSVEAQIVVGTPGTIRDLIGRQKIDVRKVKMLVADEADQMLDESEGDNSMGEQTTSIRNVIDGMSKGQTQFVLFSATFPDAIQQFANNFAPNANEIRLKPNELNVREIKQFFVDCPHEEAKYDTLIELYTLLTIGQSIVFVRTKESARRLVAMLREQGHKVAELNSDLEITERDEQMKQFRTGALKVMIATNVVARGLDVLSVNMVINYDLPTTFGRNADAETYLHRVGRTGRFGRQGIAINMVASQETHDQMLEIESMLGIKLVRLDGSDFNKMERVLKQTLKA